MNISSIWEFIKKTPVNFLALSLLALAASIVFLTIALSGFTVELSLVRRDLPRSLERIDKQIVDVQKILKSAESSGKSFSSGINKDISTGINKGISEGIVDLPLNTVANVGYKLSDTAATTGTRTYGFWQGIKEKLTFWPAKKTPPTSEAKPKLPKN